LIVRTLKNFNMIFSSLYLSFLCSDHLIVHIIPIDFFLFGWVVQFGERLTHKIDSGSYYYVGPTIINYFLVFRNFCVSISLQMDEMERIINGEDLNSWGM
jgi:hypothetical protein